MWVAKFTFDASKALVGNLAVKNKVLLHCYPVSIYKHDSDIRVSFVMVIHHDHSKRFIQDLKKSERVVCCKYKDGFVIGQLLESCKYDVLYNPEIIHLRPWIIDGERGLETFVMGSWKRSNLTRIADIIKEKHLGKLIYIKRKEVSDFFMVNVMPKMTVKQRKALELAIRHGYYAYPRKITLKTLSKMMKLSYSTFHAHLRKAEQKIIPYLRGETAE